MGVSVNQTAKPAENRPAACPYYDGDKNKCRLCGEEVHPAKRRLYCQSACPGAYRACLFWCRYSL